MTQAVLCCGAWFVVAVFGCSALAAGAPTKGTTVTRLGDGGWGLRARGADWAEVLDHLACAAGLKIHDKGLPACAVDLDCTGPSLERMLKDCFSGAGGSVVIRLGAREEPSEAWLNLERRDAPSATRGPCRATPGSASLTLGNAMIKPAVALADDKEQSPRDVAMAMLASPEPDTREQGLSQLQHLDHTDDNGAIRALFESALQDDSASVRGQAVYGLARRDGPIAFGVLKTALSDNEETVRIMAVDGAVVLGEAGLPLLRRALGDPSPEVRRYAREKLEIKESGR